MSVNRNVTVPAGSAPSVDGPGTTAGNSSVTSRPLLKGRLAWSVVPSCHA